MKLQLNKTALNICELHQQRAGLLKRQYDVLMLVKSKKKRGPALSLKRLWYMPSIQEKLKEPANTHTRSISQPLQISKTLEVKKEDQKGNSKKNSPKKSAIMDKLDRLERMVFINDFE